MKAMAALVPNGLVLGIDQSLDMLVQASRRNRLKIERDIVQPTNVCSESFIFAELFPKTGKATLGNSALVSKAGGGLTAK